MTSEDRSIINKFKEKEVIEQAKKAGINKQRNLQYAAKCELLWAKEGAIEKDFDQLHDWVKNRFSNNYEKYYRIYTEADDFLKMNDEDRREFIDTFHRIPIDEQIRISYEYWTEDKRREETSNRQLGWTVAIVIAAGIWLIHHLFS